MRARLTLGFAVLCGVFAACGGRSIQEEGEAGASAGGRNQGGTNASAAGRGGSGGSISRAGANQGGTVAGTAAAGGSCECPNIGCAPNARLVPNPNGCCFHCESDCPPACPDLVCRPGTDRRMLPGDCCPRCFEDVCWNQREVYLAIRAELFEKYATIGCTDSSECAWYYESNACAFGCGIPLAASITSSLDANLESAAASICTPECAPPILPCGPLAAPSCVNNLCVQ